MPNPDASREAAHKRYEAAQEVVQNNPDVSLDQALSQKQMNLDWQPGDPTYQDVSANWDYYKNLTNGGQIPISEVSRQQQVYQTPVASAVDRATNAQEQEESQKPRVLVNDAWMTTPDERMQRDQEEVRRRLVEQQEGSLRPSVVAENSQSKSLDQLRDEFDQWEQEYNSRNGNDRLGGEVQRRFTDMETGDVKSPLDWNLLGFTSQQKTPEAARNLYDYYFAQQDQMLGPRTPNRTWGVENTQGAPEVSILPGRMMASGFQNAKVGPDDFWNETVVDRNAIDNGESPESREALYMTGDQYLRYRNELGIPGRPVEEIINDPNAIYSKQDEMENYGFVPYLVSDEGLDRFHNDASAAMTNNMFNHLTDLRRGNTDYSFDYDGNSYDAKDFIKQYKTWENGALGELNREDNFIQNPVNYVEGETPETARLPENDISAVPYTWVLVDSQGNEHQAPGQGVVTRDPETRQPMIDFGTGSTNDNWYFDDDEDFGKSLKRVMAQDGQPVFEWQEVNPLTMSDGRQIRADRAFNLYDNQDDYANYGPFSWGKPSVESPKIEDGSWAPWFVDMALGSAPLFFGPTAGAQAFGNAWQNAQGFRAGYQTDDGRYGLLSENPTREQQLMTAAGSAMLPATERLWGVAGNVARSPVEKILARRRPDIAAHPGVRLVNNMVGEGVEEIPGNIVEEMQSAGTVGDYFANPLYYYINENGERVYTTEENNPYDPEKKNYPAMDAQGKRLTDQSTDLGGRVWNFAEEAPASMLGGAALGGALSATPVVGNIWQPVESGDTYRDLRDKRRQVGYNMIVPEEINR